MNCFKRAIKLGKKDIIEEILILCALLIAFFAIVFPIVTAVKLYTKPDKKVDPALTAGISKELADMQGLYSATTVSENDVRAVEAYVYSVEMSALQDAIEEEIKAEEEAAEEAREESLINYFGYIPSDEELEHYYMIVMDECGYEPEDGIAAVANVIANRCKSEKYPDTIDGVIYQRGQFQPIGDGTFGRFEVTDLVREICDDQIAEGGSYPYTKFRTGHYHEGSSPGEKIGNHYFSY